MMVQRGTDELFEEYAEREAERRLRFAQRHGFVKRRKEKDGEEKED
jgi:hypothetical protein